MREKTALFIANIGHALPRLQFCGATCWVAWMLLYYTGDFFRGVASEDVGALNALSYCISTGALTAVMMASAAFFEQASRIVRSPVGVISNGLAASAGTVAAAFSAAVPALFPLFVIGGVAAGVGTGFIALRCAMLFAELRPRDAMAVAAAVQILAYLLYTFGTTSEMPVVSMAMLVCLPALAALFLLLGDDLPMARPWEARVLPERFGRLVIAVFLLAFTFSVVRGYFPNGITLEEFALSRDLTTIVNMAGCFAVMVACCLCRDDFDVGAICYWIMLAITLSFVIAPVMMLNTFSMGSLFGAANGVMQLAVWSLLSAIAYKTGSSTLRVFGLGFGGVMLGSTLGWGAGFVLYSLSDAITFQAINALLVIIVLAVAFLLLNRQDMVRLTTPPVLFEDEVANVGGELDEEGVRGDSGGGDAGEELAMGDGEFLAGSDGTARSDVRPHWRIRMLELAAQFELSPRETDVFLLAARGMASQNIADELCISYNTARTHVRNVYAKCGVHSRYELLKMTDAGLDP